YDAGELVGEGEASEGVDEVGAVAGGLGPSVGGADVEGEALGSVVAETANAGGELLGGELLAAVVEQDGVGADAAGVLVEPGEERGLGVEDVGVAGDNAGCAGDVVGEQAVGGFGFGAGSAGKDGRKGDLRHQAMMPQCGGCWLGAQW